MKTSAAFMIILGLLCQAGYSQEKTVAKIALVQTSARTNQDPFMADYEPGRVRPLMIENFENILGMYEKAGRMNADLVCGPEDIQNIGSYGLYIDKTDPETGKILFSSMALKIPGPFTDRLADIARKYRMYIIAPLYEEEDGRIYNTALLFDRQGNIIGKHRKTVLPVMETWLVDTGNEFEVFQTDFAAIAIATCWEMFYPEIATIYALKGADIIFNPTMALDNKPGHGLETASTYITRARDNSVYIAPVILGTEGTGIIDFHGNVIAEAYGEKDRIIMTEIDFGKERISGSEWWKTINGTDNTKAIHFKSRRPELYKMITEANPPVLDRYRDIRLTTGDRRRQLEAVRKVDYGPGSGSAADTEPGSLSDISELKQLGLDVIPYPREVTIEGEDFIINEGLMLVLDRNAGKSDRFTAEELIHDLNKKFSISARIGNDGSRPAVVLTRHRVPRSLPAQGYQITVSANRIEIKARSDDGLFYGTQTLLQLIRKEGSVRKVPGMIITDWPDIKNRAVHYDTKHHQDKASYVKDFIREVAYYKINMLVWEWEDKFAYPSHPEIGAPGAFTMEEMQEFTRYARKYHVQIIPLVQGLGHVSYILKWPQHRHLREIEASNWEFCPLKEGSYDLLFDLWKDGIEATPGSEYIHIGSDETYELGSCEQCRAKSEEIGKSGLYHFFIKKSGQFLQSKGRKVMAWESPMGWTRGRSPAKGIEPLKGLILTESYDYETPDLKYVREARSRGFETYAYDPNPEVVPMMVPYFFEKGEKEGLRTGSLEKSFGFLSHAATSGVFGGMICTSWDDDGLHNQMWMMHFINAAARSWNGNKPSLREFTESYFRNYYGTEASDMEELFRLLNEAVHYFARTMERNVWHYGEIGKTRLPDLPRGDALEYDPFWNTEYREKVGESAEILEKMNRALEIIRKNIESGADHKYDFEIFRTTAELVKHTSLTFLDLSDLENTIRTAHVNRFVNTGVSIDNLLKAQQILENLLERRETVFNDLVKTYETTRFPKGYSTAGKEFFWQQDRARHFAFRRPDMSFLIWDEQLLDIEGYLEKLKNYTEFFREHGTK
ncbi:MAG TPA: nitrilase-related carbon-nitrogen hydrolase [Bacteroidales bacterium]|nr:nitrilase-related carbon-nitrogen hydrolase [Bacteroidales bacterium]